MHKISDTVERKFTESYPVSEWSIMTDTGWEEIEDVKQTIPYTVWKIETESGKILECADTHIVFLSGYKEVFVKDLTIGDGIITNNGLDSVVSIQTYDYEVNMYDIGVKSYHHRFYSNGILSHNTTSAAGYLLWYAMFNPDATVLIAAHKYAGAQEIMHRVRFAYESCPDHIRAGVVTYNKGSIDFDNGSRIVSQATTENTGRGMSISLLYMDEYGFVRPNIAKEFWTAIAPTLSTGGKCIITSTPNSDEDQFALIWKGANKTIDEYGNPTDVGINGFKAFTCSWREHPDRGDEWEREQRAQIGDEKFEREMNCQFIINDETLISSMFLANMKGIDPIEKLGQVRWYKKPSPHHVYIVALDPSLGTGSDPAAIQILELPGLQQVGEWQHNKTSIQNQVRILKDIATYIIDCTGNKNDVYYSVENNTLGEAALVAISDIGEENIPGIFLSEPKTNGSRVYRKGFTTTNKSKPMVCSKLKHLVETSKIIINSKNLISELKNFVSNGTSFAAKPGETDDLVMSLLLGIRMVMVLQNYDSRIDSEIRGVEEYEMPLPFIMVTG